MLVLESRQHALNRGATVRVRLAGSGVSCDAQHMTKPQAQGQVRALRNALRASGLAPRDGRPRREQHGVRGCGHRHVAGHSP